MFFPGTFWKAIPDREGGLLGSWQQRVAKLLHGDGGVQYEQKTGRMAIDYMMLP